MKKIINLATMMLAALTGCTDDIYQSDSMASGENQVIFSVEEFTYGDETRASYTPSDDRYHFSWTEGDTLGVFGTETDYQVEFPIGDNANGNTVSFDGGNFGVRPGNHYVAYYPYNYDISRRALKFKGMNTTTQTGNGSTAHLGKQDIMVSVYTQADNKGNANFEMKHLCSLLCFEVNAPEIGKYTKLKFSCYSKFYSDYAYYLGKESSKLEPDTQTASSEYVVNLEDVTTTKADEIITVYAMIPSGKFRTDGLAFTLVMDDGTEFVYDSPIYVDGDKPIRNFYPTWDAGRAYKYKLNNRYADDNGHEFVDMGVVDNDGNPIYFATWNLGANAPEEYGLYFTWGDVTGYSVEDTHTFDLQNYVHYEVSSAKYTKYTEYKEDGSVVLSPDDDAAHVLWGENWRMPTRYEFKELLDNCTWKPKEVNGVSGLAATSKITNATLFFPYSGACMDDEKYTGGDSWFWTSSLDEDTSRAYGATIQTGAKSLATPVRYLGFSIRPVYNMYQKVEEITIKEPSVTIGKGEQKQLTYSVSPKTALYKSVLWSSANENIARVSDKGIVTGVSTGSTTIIATAVDGSGVSATCDVTVHDLYVDLGMRDADGKPIYWATCNIGANTPEEVGLLFAWGETKGYTEDEGHNFNLANYSYFDKIHETEKYVYYFNKYCFGPEKYYSNEYYDGLHILEPADDAAHVNLGSNWRMPTTQELEDLLNKYGKYIKYRESNGKGYFEFWSVDEGDLLLTFPATNYYSYPRQTVAACSSWSSEIGNGGVESAKALDLSINQSNEIKSVTASMSRYVGLPIRPVYHEYQRVNKITLDKTSITLCPQESQTIVGTVAPDNAFYKNLTWSSTNENVAKVTQTGKVIGVAMGTATIIAKAKDNTGITATCTVTVTDHQFVDLGLPSGTLWATCNIGARSLEDVGMYFAWGETEGYYEEDGHVFSESNYKFYDKVSGKYIDMQKRNPLPPEDDAASVNWGCSWHIPSPDDVLELLNNCEVVSINNKPVFKFTSKKNGNYIIMPMPKHLIPTGNNPSKSSYMLNSLSNAYKCNYFEFQSIVSSGFPLSGCFVYDGYAVRPVHSKTTIN